MYYIIPTTIVFILAMIYCKKYKYVNIILILIFIVISILSYAHLKVDNFLDSITNKYYLVSLEELDKNTITNQIGVLDTDYGKFNFIYDKYTIYTTYESLLTSLDNKESEAIVLNEESAKKLKGYYVQELVVEEIDYENSFNVYITGTDNSNDITENGRSDYNVLATVNAKTGKVILTSIPRDYYVQIYSYYDKLTHISTYGMYQLMDTVSILLDTKIDYYVKVNFDTVTQLVDILGNVSVYNEEKFTTYGYTFEKGDITLTSSNVLTFLRARKNFDEGDFKRIENGQLVLIAIYNSLKSTSTVVNHSKILEVLEGTFETNIPKDSIYEAMFLNTTFDIESIYLEGTNSYSTETYSYPNQSLAIVIPSEESLKYATNKINELLNN